MKALNNKGYTMKRNIIRLTAALVAFSCIAAYSQQKTVFILDFRNGSKFNDASLGQGMAAMFSDALAESGGFRVVERGAVLQAVMKEPALSLSGAMSDMGKAVRIGQLVGTDGLIAGTVTDFGIQQTGATKGSAGKKNAIARVAVTARLVDISTAEVVAAVQGTGESSVDAAAGAALPATFDFGTEGFYETPFGKAARQAIGKAVTSLCKQTGTKMAEVKAPAAPLPSAPAPVAPLPQPESPAPAAPAQTAALAAATPLAMPAPALEGTGDLYIATDPPGAAVVIDGSPVSGVTPITLQSFKAGFHKIDVTDGARFGTTTITLQKDDLLKVNVKMQSGKGTLKIFVQPDGADVVIDGKSCGTPPLKIDNIAAGKHELQISKNGFFTDKQTVKIAIGALQTVNLTLNPLAYLSLTVKPDANVMVNGNPPQKNKDGLILAPAGEVTVRIAKEGYDTSVSTLTLAPGETKKLDVQLSSAYGTLRVITDPPGAKVMVNDRETGKTPYTNAKLEPGTYTVQVDLKDYESQKGSVTVQKNETKEVSSKLLYLYGILKVTSKPSGAKVFINEQQAGITPFSSPRAQLGNSMLRVSLPGYEEVRENIAVVREAACEKAYELTHTKAFLDSVAAYKVHRYKKCRMTRRITFGLLGAASFGAGAIFNGIAQSHIDKMNSIQDKYRTAPGGFRAYEPQWSGEKKKADSGILTRNILYGVAGAFGAAFLISIPF
jgi:curli biogenesis system outer membrane secretion channel CsgG